MKIILVIMLIVNSAFADDCTSNAQIVKKGTAAPCDGVLLSNNAAKKADQNSVDLNYYKDLTTQMQERQDDQNKEMSVLDQRLKLYVDESTTLAKKDKEDGWQKWAYFLAGVVGTGLAASAMYHNR